MVIEYPATQSIFDFPYDYYKVCPVNTKGRMGAGLAAQFRVRYPAANEFYMKRCLNQEFLLPQPGSIHLYADRAIKMIFAYTKDHWYYQSQPIWVQWILAALQDHDWLGLDIVIPALGCGLGGLPWENVRAAVHHYGATTEARWHLLPPRKDG